MSRAHRAAIADPRQLAGIPLAGPSPASPNAGLKPIEFSRMEKALVVAACFPFLVVGLLLLFA
jgi:hypothetical protein